jgi:N-methylhydantoinase A/oxoprolinase/acetone carboxylase beta subunit
MTRGPYAIGLDIGGTFTDLVLVDHDGAMRVHKLLTTPANPAAAALRGVNELLTQADVPIGGVDLLVHSTTLVTNALTEQRGARTGLIGTHGFRDLLEMRNEHRYDIYDLFLEWPPPLVPRERRVTVVERVLRDGTVMISPEESDITSAVEHLKVEGVEAIAISLLHSYRNPINERRVAEVVRRLVPDIPVTISFDVAPIIREYERTSTAVADAYVRPLTSAYLTQMQEGLADLGFTGSLLLMLSGGGSASIESARQNPIRMVESGPAAGALAAGHYGKMTGADPLISFDMGGTTAKICLVMDGRPAIVNTLEIARTRRFNRGSGIPVVSPSVELIEIGAGGGSIARLDAMGLLKVGPHSAGADPGPVCYGLGGTEPTVTDANLMLGLLDPEYFLGGRLRLDVTATRRAFQQLGAKAGMTAIEAAWGVHRVVNENMAQAARMHLQERNVDPRKLSMIAFGGAGPAHAASIAALLGTSRLVFPLGAGATSALGCLVAPLSFQFVRSSLAVLGETDWRAVNALFDDMTQSGYAALADAGADRSSVRIMRQADVRVYGQQRELTIPVVSGPLVPKSIPGLTAAFAEVYRQVYGRYDLNFLLEVVNWKLNAVGPSRHVVLRASTDAKPGGAVKKYRPVFLPTERRLVDTPVYDRYLLATGEQITGPAIVEEREATVSLPLGSTATIDSFGDLILELSA